MPVVPSEATLRQRLDDLGRSGEVSEVVNMSNIELLKNVIFWYGKKCIWRIYSADIDVSPMNNAGSSWTYKNHDGYAPIFA